MTIDLANLPDKALSDVSGTERVILNDGGAAKDLSLGEIASYARGNLNDIGYDAWILVGQSNRVGRGVRDDLRDSVAHPRIFQFGCAPGDLRYQTIFRAADKLHWPEGDLTATQMGADLVFARHLVDSLPAGRRILLVPLAWGNTGLTGSGQWNPSAGAPAGVNPVNNVPGALYENAIAMANLALAAACAELPASRIAGIKWCQGEASLGDSTYAAAFDALVAGFRSRIIGAAQAPVICMSMIPEFINRTTLPYPHIAQVTALSRLEGIGFAPGVPNMSGDFTHYSAAGLRIMGAREAQQVAPALANVLGSQPAVVPLPPVLTPLSASSLRVEWAAPLSRAVTYNVRWRVSPSGGWTTVATTTPERVAILTGLTAVPIDVQVATVNEQGVSDWSPTATATPVNVLPGLVYGASSGGALVATPNNDGSVTVAWLAPVTGGTPTDYRIEYRLSSTAPNGAWTTFSRSPSTALSAVLTGLTLGSGHQLRVTALNSAGAGTPSAIVTVTPQVLSIPAQVTGLRLVAVGSTSIGIAWDVPLGPPTDYFVEYRTSPSGTWTPFADGVSTTPEATVTGLTTDVDYDLRVSASNGLGTGPVSATVTARTVVYLDAAVGAPLVLGYSPFKLRGAYAGAYGRASRSADASTSDLAINAATNRLDNATINAFAGSGDVFNDIIYNQGTQAGADLAVMTGTMVGGGAILAPQLASAGAIIPFGGSGSVPSVKYGRVNNTTPTGLTAATPASVWSSDWTLFAVVFAPSGFQIGGIVPSGSDTTSEFLFGQRVSGSEWCIQLRAGSTTDAALTLTDTAQNVVSAGRVFTFGQKHLITITYTASTRTYVVWLNGTQVGTGTGISDLTLATFFSVGVLGGRTANSGSRGFTGQRGEMALFAGVLNATQRAAGEAHIKARWGTV
jgi:hypothetical protein